jgi:hypothetical protein
MGTQRNPRSRVKPNGNDAGFLKEFDECTDTHEAFISTSERFPFLFNNFERRSGSFPTTLGV